MKKTIKKTAKVTKPKYTISMISAANDDDVVASFIIQKAMNGMKLTESDFNTILSIATDLILEDILPEDLSAVVNDGGVYRKCTAVRVEEKVKKPWYKRAWNWITRKK